MDEAASLDERILQGIADAMIYADKEGLIRRWNAGAVALFGLIVAFRRRS